MPHTATYNQDNDKLYLFPGERLTDDEYQRVTACGLRWWRGHKAFVGNWTPEREDVVQAFATIEAVDEPEDFQGRAARFTGKAKRAQGRADARRGAVRQIMDAIPLGQPMLRDHSSARRYRRDMDRVDAHHKALRAEQGKADHYTRRAEGTARRERQLHTPAHIARRIETLKAEQRKCARRVTWGASSAEHAQRWADHLGQRIKHEETRLARLVGETGQGVPVPTDFQVGQHVATVRGKAEVIKVTPKKVKCRMLDGESPHLPGPFREWLEKPERLRPAA